MSTAWTRTTTASDARADRARRCQLPTHEPRRELVIVRSVGRCNKPGQQGRRAEVQLRRHFGCALLLAGLPSLAGESGLLWTRRRPPKRNQRGSSTGGIDIDDDVMLRPAVRAQVPATIASPLRTMPYVADPVPVRHSVRPRVVKSSDSCTGRIPGRGGLRGRFRGKSARCS